MIPRTIHDAGVSVIERPEQVRYLLPRRALWTRLIGVPVVAFGCFMAFSAAQFLFRIITGSSSIDLLTMSLMISAGLSIPITIGMAVFGVWILLAQYELIVSPTAIESISRIGPLRRTRLFPTRNLTEIAILTQNNVATACMLQPRYGEARQPIPRRFRPSDGPSGQVLYSGLSRATLAKLAHHITEQLARLRANPDSGDVTIAVTHNDIDAIGDPIEIETPAPTTLPKGSRITMSDHASVATINVPPPPAMPNTILLLLVGIAMVGISGVAFYFAAQTFSAGNAIAVLPAGVSLVFAFAGGYFIRLYVTQFRVNTQIQLSRHSITVTSRNVSGTKQFQFSRDEIVDIALGPSGMSTTHETGPRRVAHTVFEVQLRYHSHERLGIAAGYSKQELRWLAWQLSQWHANS